MARFAPPHLRSTVRLRGITGRMILSHLLLATLPLILLGVIVMTLSRQALTRSSFELLERVTTLKQVEIDRFIQGSRADLEQTSRNPDFSVRTLNFLDLLESPRALQNVQELLRNAFPATAGFRDVFVLDARTGARIASVTDGPLGAIYATDPVFIEGLKQVYTSPIIIDSATGQPTLSIGAPIRDTLGVVVAVLVGQLDLDRISQLLNTTEGLASTQQSYLVVGGGAEATMIGRPTGTALRAEVASHRAETVRNEQYVNAANQEVFGVARYVPAYDGVIVAEQEVSEALALSSQLRTVLMTTVVLTFVVIVLAAVWLARSLATPTLSLTRAARAIAQGDRTVSLPTTAPHELGVLADAFQQMVTTITQRETALLKTQHELIAAKAVAEEANQLKSRFLANMSHELRTPLNAIINFSGFIQEEGGLSSEQDHLIGRVASNGRHLLGIINDILDLSKIEAGHMQLTREMTDLTPILRGVMATATGLVSDKPVRLELELPDSVPQVFIDPTRIRQVLLNLLSNAAKFTDTGEIIVDVGVPDPATLLVAVRDTGPGIPLDQQADIFNEFYQVQGDYTREYHGTGLGLPISRRLVDMHGGRMWVESTPGQGSTFFFTLPLASPADPAGDEEQARLPLTFDTTAASQVDIVIVDDDLDAQQTLRYILEPAGYRIAAVTDSREAVQTVIKLRPRLIVLDIQMPYLDGWEVLAHIKQHPGVAGTPVVICSVRDPERLGTLFGVTSHIVKPVQKDVLLEVIGARIQQSASVLIIDDDLDTRHVLTTILTQAGYTVCTAGDGVEGLQVLEAKQPNLVLLDLMMPHLDGFATLRQIRAQPEYAYLPVVIVSAKDLTAEERRELTEQAQYYMAKDQLSTHEFLTMIRAYTEGASNGSQ